MKQLLNKHIRSKYAHTYKIHTGVHYDQNNVSQ